MSSPDQHRMRSVHGTQPLRLASCSAAMLYLSTAQLVSYTLASISSFDLDIHNAIPTCNLFFPLPASLLAALKERTALSVLRCSNGRCLPSVPLSGT